jgi:hypothetical protein
MSIPKRAKIVEIFEKSQKNLTPEPSSEMDDGQSKCTEFGKISRILGRNPAPHLNLAVSVRCWLSGFDFTTTLRRGAGISRGYLRVLISDFLARLL